MVTGEIMGLPWDFCVFWIYETLKNWFLMSQKTINVKSLGFPKTYGNFLACQYPYLQKL